MTNRKQHLTNTIQPICRENHEESRLLKRTLKKTVEHESEYLDQVKDFKFLGSYKSAGGDCTNEVKRRIAMAHQKAVELTTIWKDKNVTSALTISDEVDGLGSVSVWSGGIDIKEIG